MEQLIDFFINDKAFGGALGAFLVICGCHFASLDVGVRKNKPLHKEPILKQGVYILIGWLVAAMVNHESDNLRYLIYVSVGAGWIFVLQGFVNTAQLFSKAMTKRHEAVLNAGQGGQQP